MANVGALVWVIAVVVMFAVVPVEGEVSAASSGGPAVVTHTSSTLLETEGTSVLVVLALPAVPAIVALARRRRTTTLVAAWVTTVFCLLGSMTIGLFYVPAAVLLFLAAHWQRARPQEPAASRQYAA